MQALQYKIPLTKAMGKIRIKERFAFSDYGKPIAPTQTIITPKHYIEWQIGYDTIVSKSENYHFIGANGKAKQIYELSEILESGLKMGLVSKKDMENLLDSIQSTSEFIDTKETITRSNFIQENISGIEFLKSNVSYPLLIHKFENNDLLCEISWLKSNMH